MCGAMRLAVLGLFLVLGASGPVWAGMASFDCDKAAAPVERMICADPELMRLDGVLGTTFAERRKAAGDAGGKEMLTAQREWLKRRIAACNVPAQGPAPGREQIWAAAGCLVKQYRIRLAELGAPDNSATEPAPPETRAVGFIHPLCLEMALADFAGETPVSPPPPVPVAACARGVAHVLVDKNATTQVLGAMTTRDGYPGWTGYKSIGRLSDGREALLVQRNGGGSGTFSSLVALTRTPASDGRETLITTAELLGGGDRCIGGIADAAMQQGGKMLSVSSHVTMADVPGIIGLSLDKKQEERLAFCAVCCVGTVRATVTLGTTPLRSERTTFEIIERDGLEQLAKDDDKLTACLANTLLRASGPAIPHSFPKAEWPALAKRLRESCVP